jgi:hypothetical protein
MMDECGGFLILDAFSGNSLFNRGAMVIKFYFIHRFEDTELLCLVSSGEYSTAYVPR